MPFSFLSSCNGAIQAQGFES